MLSIVSLYYDNKVISIYTGSYNLLIYYVMIPAIKDFSKKAEGTKANDLDEHTKESETSNIERSAKIKLQFENNNKYIL